MGRAREKATTLEDASDLFAAALNPRITSDEIAAHYVEPPRTHVDSRQGREVSVRAKITRLLVRRRDEQEKFYVTGQKGAGKTTTLARIARDPEVVEHFAPLLIRATQHLPAGAADIRLLLVMLVAELSRFIDAESLDARVERAGIKVQGVLGALSGWLGLMRDTALPEPPRTLQSAKAEVGASFLKLSAEVARDSQRRKQVLEDRRYSVTELGKVVSALIAFAQQALAVRVEGPQFLLLIIDDLDKYTVPSEVKSIFYDGLEELRALPCAAILTYPYFLNFNESFAQGEGTFAIQNVKVARRELNERGEPVFPPLGQRELLPSAQTFFNALYEKLADRALIADQTVLDRAALLSAGIPREFLRLLSAGFELCLDHDKGRLDLGTLEVARIRQQQTMARTANEPWKQSALKLVQVRGLILQFSEMLETMHVVEYVNSAVWYGVHPVMEDLVESWIRQDRSVLIETGTDPTEAHRELEERWRQDAERRPQDRS